MPISNSKQSNIIYLQNERLLTFYHDTISTDVSEYYFYQEQDSQVLYTLTLNDANNNGYRCLQYQNFDPHEASLTYCPFVIYENQGMNTVLYETNFVTANMGNNDGSVVCTFWSTLMSGKTCKKEYIDETAFTYGRVFTDDKGQKYYYKYQPSYVQKIQSKNIVNFELQDSYSNIFCSASIEIIPLYVSIDGGQTRIPQDVAIIRNPPIILLEEKASQPVFDFSLQGSGGGIGQHSHIPHVDGTNFAFAVFHPGTAMPQLAWDNL